MPFPPNTQLDFLDELAIAILADCGALIENQSKQVKTPDHDHRCVAVTDIDGTLLIAANNLFVTKDVVNGYKKGKSARKSPKWDRIKNNINKGDPIADSRKDLFELFGEANSVVASSGVYDNAIFVTGVHTYFNNYHAEMQLLQFMLDYHVRPARRYIGVSKPCCPECTAILRAAKFNFTGSHDRNAHAVRNAEEAFTHPHLRIDELAGEFARGARGLPRSLAGSYEAPF